MMLVRKLVNSIKISCELEQLVSAVSNVSVYCKLELLQQIEF